MLNPPNIEQLKPVFTCKHSMRWGDMDAMGHINNTIYFRYMEHARIAWLESLGCAPRPDSHGPVIVNAWCNFRKQLVYPGDIEIRIYAGLPRRSSFETIMEVRRADDTDTVYAVGGATTVWVDFPNEKSVPLPQAMRQLLE